MDLLVKPSICNPRIFSSLFYINPSVFFRLFPIPTQKLYFPTQKLYFPTQNLLSHAEVAEDVLEHFV